MFEWMNKHKKDIMKYTLWLVIPSFVLLYGYGEFAKPDINRWIVKVNGQEVTEREYQLTMQNLRNQSRQNPNQPELTTDEVEQQALDSLIVSTLMEQKANQLGIATTNQEVVESIRQIEYFQDETQTFNLQRYQALLRQLGYSEVQFEEEQRDSITRSKVQSVLASAFFRSQPDKERTEGKQQETVKVEFLAFQPSSYSEDVEVNEEDLKQFFEKNIEDYRIPEQRRIAYARFTPGEFIPQVTINERQMERFFQQNVQQYEIPKRVRMEYIKYSGENFTDQVNVTEDEILTYYQENQNQYTHPPQVKARYIQIPVEEFEEQQQITDNEIQTYYEENIEQYEHEEQAKFRHILLKVDPNATEEEEEAVRQRMLEIRQEIQEGLSFEEAAQKYSEDPGSKERGGLYDFFGRGRMVQPFEDASFELPLGQVSEPVKTQFGYHLIVVEDRRPAGTTPLEQVRGEIREQLQQSKAIETVREMANTTESLDELSDQYTIQTTDWFSRRDNLPAIPQSDSYSFISTAFSEAQEGVKMAGNTRSENLYLIETIDRQDSTQKTLEEARSEVIEDIQQERGQDLANQAAQADFEEIQSASVELQVIAQNHNLAVQITEPFSRSDRFIPGFGPSSPAITQAIFTMQQGEIRGPITSGGASYIIRAAAIEEPRLPEFEEVRMQVEQDYTRNQAEVMAKAEANAFSMDVFRQETPISQVAADNEIDWGTTPFFQQNDPIPSLGPVNSVNQQAFQLQNILQVSDAVEQRAQQNQFQQQPNQQQPVQAYYVVQLLEIKDPYLPEIEEVREDVVEDYRLKMAEPIAVEHAENTLTSIKSYMQSSEPVSATQTVDLSEFQYQETAEENLGSKGARYQGPYEVNGLGQVPTIGRAIQLTKTAFSLEPGEISTVVTNYRSESNEEGERIQGPMTGAYIIQVLEKPEETEEDPQQGRFQQMEQFMNRMAQQQAFSAWIDEASATAEIEYNDDLLALDDEEETMDAESAEATNQS